MLCVACRPDQQGDSGNPSQDTSGGGDVSGTESTGTMTDQTDTDPDESDGIFDETPEGDDSSDDGTDSARKGEAIVVYSSNEHGGLDPKILLGPVRVAVPGDLRVIGDFQLSVSPDKRHDFSLPVDGGIHVWTYTGQGSEGEFWPLRDGFFDRIVELRIDDDPYPDRLAMEYGGTLVTTNLQLWRGSEAGIQKAPPEGVSIELLANLRVHDMVAFGEDAMLVLTDANVLHIGNLDGYEERGRADLPKLLQRARRIQPIRSTTGSASFWVFDGTSHGAVFEIDPSGAIVFREPREFPIACDNTYYQFVADDFDADGHPDFLVGFRVPNDFECRVNDESAILFGTDQGTGAEWQPIDTGFHSILGVLPLGGAPGMSPVDRLLIQVSPWHRLTSARLDGNQLVEFGGELDAEDDFPGFALGKASDYEAVDLDGDGFVELVVLRYVERD